MAITYIWSIDSMDSYPQAGGFTDVVFKANYRCAATDGTNTEAVVGGVDVNLDNTGPFTPYADLTEDQVISWVQAALTPDGVEATQQAAEAALSYRYYRPVTLPNPWS
jgi:hypothetical protein